MNGCDDTSDDVDDRCNDCGFGCDATCVWYTCENGCTAGLEGCIGSACGLLCGDISCISGCISKSSNCTGGNCGGGCG